MRYSQLIGRALKTPPKEAETISHKLLTQAGFIDRQLSAGIYSFLPLGWKVMNNIMDIIKEEMNNIGGQEVFLPTLQPKELWEKSDRWEHIDPPLFKLKDRHEKELGLGSTHEEVITDLVTHFVQSYKDLPLYLYQIQNKFRNEMRSTGGLLRVREFMMKDLYSFNTRDKDLDDFYLKVVEAYKKIFTRCGLVTKIVDAQSGSIGGNFSNEFMMLCPTGEDKVLCCTKCDWAENEEKGKEEKCPKCGGELEESSAIENGHVFKLGTRYSEKLGAYFTSELGEKKPIVMGCYGIGVGRLMATIVESNNDEKGIVWPKEVAPYHVHLMNLGHTTDNIQQSNDIYAKLTEKGIEVLYDDRDASAGEKFADCDLIGLPIRLIVSEKTQGKIEFKKRNEEKSEILTLEEVLEKLADE